MTRTKERFANKMHVPVGIEIPFFYPDRNVRDPQSFVGYWRALNDADGLLIFGAYWNDLGDWKSNSRPFGLYDGAANFMYGASGVALGVSTTSLLRIGDFDHLGQGGNSPVNNASISAGCLVGQQGWTPSLVPYTWTWP